MYGYTITAIGVNDEEFEMLPHRGVSRLRERALSAMRAEASRWAREVMKSDFDTISHDGDVSTVYYQSEYGNYQIIFTLTEDVGLMLTNDKVDYGVDS